VDPGPLFYIYYFLLQALFTSAIIIHLLQINIIFHTIRLILYYQQTGEIDNLTASWGKVSWLCCVLVPHCYWRRHHAIKDIFWRRCQSQPATTFGSGFFLLLVD
jgi:hypothetical protein